MSKQQVMGVETDLERLACVVDSHLVFRFAELSEERLKEADHSRMRDESWATLPPLVMPRPLPAGLNLRRYAPGIGIGLVIATAFLLGGLFMAPLWASGSLDVMTWIQRVIG